MTRQGGKPRWPIESVKARLFDAFFDRPNAVAPVAAELGCNDLQAIQYMRQQLRLLLCAEAYRDRFVFRVGGKLAGKHADVYFIKDRTTDPDEPLEWYVKLRVRDDDGVVHVHSFHKPEHRM